jgi:hypothetical protein
MYARAVKRALAMFVLAAACRGEMPASEPEADDPEAAPPEVGTKTIDVAHAPGILVHNRGGIRIEIYAAYIVDHEGKHGMRALWPHPSDCPDVKLPHRTVEDGKTLLLPPPTGGYVQGSCKPTPLPAGDYVLRLDSGYGEQLYAAAAIAVPLTRPIELEMKNHAAAPPCDAALARRAARLAFAAAKPNLPAEFERECDVETAGCGKLSLDSKLPPPKCTITLHERSIRIERAASNDAPRWLEGWTDFEVVYMQRAHVTRTSASSVQVDGKPVVIAGLSDSHMHEHGGDAAWIGAASFVVHNPHARPLPLRVTAIEFLRDSSCALPNEVGTRPKPSGKVPRAIAPGQSEIHVAFARQSAYQSHCDRFATRVTFDVAGRSITATAEHEVSRFDALH